ncbi:hypothetical protein [Fulvivirga lutea]|uniref:Uncharacterized protein n=1 Tax=Fulvivirga lutea TaxID=2810512 RepID=A0A975A1F0_9BACT|nr:hypothetical protein [Fulvivirga lutea]QSE97467.1 hypothetical protein JR347_18105 [Fulvivirga lutea]
MSNKLWSKLKALAALVTVFLLVFATNRMDKNHFKMIQKSFSSVYEDRLVAKDHIFKISRLLDIKKNDLITGEITKIDFNINDSINVVVDKYANTRLTAKEEKSMNVLKKKLSKLYEIEKSGDSSERAVQIVEVLGELDKLAEIQMLEAKRELDKSNRLVESSNLISTLEIGTLILIGIIIQMLIFFKPIK